MAEAWRVLASMHLRGLDRVRDRSDLAFATVSHSRDRFPGAKAVAYVETGRGTSLTATVYVEARGLTIGKR